MQQIAKMFATLGFNVDTTGLDTFKGKLKDARADSALLARNFRALKTAVDSANKSFVAFNTSNKIKKLGGDVASSYTGFSKAVDLVNKSFASIGMQQPTTTKALGKINAAAVHGAPKWKAYGDELARVDDLLKSIQKRLRSLGSGRPPRINTNPSNTNGGAGGRPRGGGGGNGGGSNDGSNFGGNRNNPFSFFRSMSPAVLLGGGLPALGYGLKEVVERGREQQKMENVLQFSSKGLADFNDSLAYVKKTALEVGVASADLGKAFAQINMSAEGLNKNQKKSLMTNMSTSFAVMGATKDEQGLLFKAVNQMFSLGRIQAEEMNQLTGQGLVPRKLVYDAIKEAYKVKTNEEVQKLQKANKLDPAKIMPIVFQKMMDQAEKSGALAKYKDSSLYKQSVAKENFNQLSQSIMQGGLDKMLGSIFGLLNQLMVVLNSLAPVFQRLGDDVNYLTDKIKDLSTFTDKYMGEGSLLKIILGSLIMFFLRKARVIQVVIRYARQGTTVFQKMARFLKGGLGMAIKFVTRSFLGWISVLFILIDVANAVEKSLGGKHTWMDVWAAKLEYLGALMDGWLIKMNFWAKVSGKLFQPWEWGKTGQAIGTMLDIDEKYKERQKQGITGIAKLDAINHGNTQVSAPLPALLQRDRPKGVYNNPTEIKIYLENQKKAILNVDWNNQAITQAP
ncbi:MAG: tape measure protein [Bacteroidales bacterium]|nr:tape measure protein [Candidatus Scybalousia scybalohippi]